MTRLQFILSLIAAPFVAAMGGRAAATETAASLVPPRGLRSMPHGPGIKAWEEYHGRPHPTRNDVLSKYMEDEIDLMTARAIEFWSKPMIMAYQKSDRVPSHFVEVLYWFPANTLYRKKIVTLWWDPRKMRHYVEGESSVSPMRRFRFGRPEIASCTNEYWLNGEVEEYRFGEPGKTWAINPHDGSATPLTT
jgi:hypothetical protein